MRLRPYKEAVLDLALVTEGHDPISERRLRSIVAEADWRRQMKALEDAPDVQALTPPLTTPTSVLLN